MNKFLALFSLSLLTLSCSSDLDFNQVNNLKLEPVVVANLASFDVPAHQFVSGGVEQTVSGDLLDFDIFKDSYFIALEDLLIEIGDKNILLVGEYLSKFENLLNYLKFYTKDGFFTIENKIKITKEIMDFGKANENSIEEYFSIECPKL